VTRRDALALIRAMRESEAKASVVTIDRTANGSVTFGVKASAKSLRMAREKAEEAFDALAKKYNGGKP
jgi:hypothetical protein